MIYVVYPQDVTTQFLLQIPDIIQNRIGKEMVELIDIQPDDHSYQICRDKLKGLPDNSIICFIGHGESTCLLGAENQSYSKKPFIDLKSVRILSNKYVFSLSCYSNEFFRSTFRYSNIRKSVGFGLLPSEMAEVERDKKLVSKGISESIIESYRNIICEVSARSFCDIVENGLPFIEVSNYFLLRLNKKISQAILQDKNGNEGRILADLLFQLKSDMVVI